ncbi:hypothetical protein [Mycobacteroides abscessus]|uniref:hypothetical protein n=1 Tax=Mycobacteroides abscessus TaxID=36809 RepID=UPI001041C46A|nr:hypothetical protein [Mycobacteroides abscessus]
MKRDLRRVRTLSRQMQRQRTAMTAAADERRSLIVRLRDRGVKWRVIDRYVGGSGTAAQSAVRRGSAGSP